jgi:hypothetical protein
MAIICRSHRLLFIMAPRTGCTAIGDLLCDKLQGEFLPKSDVVDTSGTAILRHKHNTLRDLFQHGLLTPDEKTRLFTFTSVRNPFDSLVSLYVKLSTTYQYLLEDKASFVHRDPGYIEDMNWCRTHSFDDWIARRYAPRRVLRVFKRRPRASMFSRYTDGADYVMRFERLQADFDEVLRRVGLEGLSIPRINPTPDRGPDYRAYYSPASRRLVEAALAEDLSRYGYSF